MKIEKKILKKMTAEEATTFLHEEAGDLWVPTTGSLYVSDEPPVTDNPINAGDDFPSGALWWRCGANWLLVKKLKVHGDHVATRMWLAVEGAKRVGTAPTVNFWPVVQVSAGYEGRAASALIAVLNQLG